jgi:hypothetical protein
LLETEVSILNRTGDSVILFPELPAIISGVRVNEVIIQVNNIKINDYEDLTIALNNSAIGEKIKLRTKYKNEFKEYDLILQEHPLIKGKGIIGIVFSGYSTSTRLIGKISNFFNLFKKPSTFYEPKFNNSIVIFIYNLIWWLALINLSVALMNMLPVGIFDGGRFFMITIWAITKNEKISQKSFKIATYLILTAFLLLMIGWALALYLPKVI